MKHGWFSLILWLIGIVVSVTIAQWLHELGHIVVALLARAPIMEIKFWPPSKVISMAKEEPIIKQLKNGVLKITCPPYEILIKDTTTKADNPSRIDHQHT